VPAIVPAVPAGASAVVEPPEKSVVPVVPIDNNRNGKSGDPRMPMESYATRQKSLGFLGNLISRWT
jgi:hypothetical protein